ncbi:flagellar assembly protein FliW [Sulfurimonas sediminis]|uniref:Flagellar assembly factor FliW n=1 Tax=Sulfurimonas sediminis TaxID=2590020 RepID=A0A7M1B4R9_9BACT|nr:flagellar assembly protein FliW [Sulfurimonas sediminis]QOP44660.1 flagellar assembly protein FliW [Sulfurimonas sediminis]
MTYEVKGEILGFVNTRQVDINEIDELFSIMKDSQNPAISFTLVNPYMLRKYPFEIPAKTKELLKITDNSEISVYTILLIQKPLEQSTVNFLAPVIINHDNNTLTQIVLEPKQNPNYGMAERIESFKKEASS